MDQIWMRINELAEANNGFVRTAQVARLTIFDIIESKETVHTELYNDI